MTFVRFKNKPAERSFNNFMDDFFTPMPSIFRDDFNTPAFKSSIPVNVKETEKEFLVEVVAPGFAKEDFSINLEKDTLTISAEKKEETPAENEKQIRKEYYFKTFKRSFTLDEGIDAAGITAQYVNGILALNLPKKAAVKEAAKQITIQ